MLPRKRSLPVTTKSPIHKCLIENDSEIKTTKTEQYYHKFKRKLSTYPKRTRYIIVTLISILTLILLLSIHWLLFGYCSIRGGLIGIGIDKYFKSRLNSYTSHKLYKKYDLLGSNNGNDNFNDPRMYYERYYELESDSLACMNKLCRYNKGQKGGHAIPMYLLQAPIDIFKSTQMIAFRSVLFSDVHVRRVLHDAPIKSNVLEIYNKVENKQLVFGIVSVYSYGGLFLSDSLLQILKNATIQVPLEDYLNSNYTSNQCYDDYLMVLIHDDLHLILASPRHPALLSVINDMDYNLNQLSSIQLQHTCKSNQCKITYPNKNTFLSYTKSNTTPESSNLYPIIKLYQETPFKPPNPIYLKKSLHLKMILQRCEPSWLCNRCLKYAGFGTYAKCSNVCKACFIDIMCNPKSLKPKLYQPIHLYMNHTSAKIPRIVHQTWFEALNIDSYPNLIRLQNSWRASGWEYRFYDDLHARNFILEYYPSVFIEAYDALIPGAFKADFFRYLVLLIHGGIYADIDLMLNTNLDTLITPNLSFITARDTVGQENNSPFCLWNGFIGSAPGHPFLIEVIQRSLNFIRNRANILDMEQDLCTKVNDLNLMESWKVKSEQGLMLTGPCALGISVNTVLKQYPLQKFPLGFLPKNDIGHVHILSLKKKDLGSLRLSDIERNVIVATTNIPYMSKFPSVEVTSSSSRIKELYPDGSNLRKGTKRLHYSYTSGSWDWGTRGVYVDSVVVDDYVKIVVKHVA